MTLNGRTEKLANEKWSIPITCFGTFPAAGITQRGLNAAMAMLGKARGVFFAFLRFSVPPSDARRQAVNVHQHSSLVGGHS